MIKEIPGIRTYVSVDGDMSDNPRPSRYGSGYESILPRASDAAHSNEARIGGKHCEARDVLVADAMLPDNVVVGGIVATPVTEACGHSLGSTTT